MFAILACRAEKKYAGKCWARDGIKEGSFHSPSVPTKSDRTINNPFEISAQILLKSIGFVSNLAALCSFTLRCSI